MFDYLNYKNKIPLEKCIVHIPRLNPLSSQYEKFWIHNIKRKQIEGMWVEHNSEWKWIPGAIFQYVNLWHIEMKKTGSTSKGKVIGKPRLRDLEWIKGYVHAVARGFSGFQDDEQYSSNRVLLSEDRDFIIELKPKKFKDSLLKPNGDYKEYIPALEYLYKYYNKNLGKPLFYNEAKNIVEISCRNVGKSFISSNFSGHNFLTDGVVDFEEWLDNRNRQNDLKETYTTQTLIGAIDSKYSNGLVSKIKLGLDFLPGKIELGESVYPAPLSKKYMGSWTCGKNIVAQYEEKVGGKWETKGSGSGFLHRSFSDNPFAANGSRYGFAIIDEVGFMYNLEETLGQLHECTTVDGEKYGTIWMTGTGGDMDGGATEAVKKVFYNPDAYECLEFDDLFENTGKKVGFFVPAWMSFDDFRDEFGNVNKELGIKKLNLERDKARQAKSKKPLNDLMQMKPLVPSEAFLISGGSIFESLIPDLKEQLAFCETSTDGDVKGTAGELIINNNGNVEFKPNLNLKECDYPVTDKGNKEGAILIWEHPSKETEYGWYVAGQDPYNQDEAENSVSLGSLFIFKRRNLRIGQKYDQIVAEYTARPDSAKTFYENCRRLLLYYSAVCLYENNFNGFKTFLETKHSLHLLAYTPTILKNNKNTTVSRTYGQNMSKNIKDELEIYTRDWLGQEVGDGKLNLHFIYSKGLLKELISYNNIGNFDRVISLMLTIAQSLQMHNLIIEKKDDKPKIDPFFTRKMFVNR